MTHPTHAKKKNKKGLPNTHGYFFLIVFVANALQHIAFCFFLLIIFLVVNSKNQRAVPTHKQKPTPKNNLCYCV